MIRGMKIGLVSLGLCAALMGCKRFEQAKKALETAQTAAGDGDTTPSRAGDSAASPEEQQDDALSGKLNPYIDCLNNASSRAFQSRDRYLSWVASDKTGPSGKERNVYGLYNVESTDMCVQGIDKARAATPSLPDVEGAAATYKGALTDLTGVIKKAHDYYEQNNYKDDKFKAGKDMHAPLMAAFDRFDQANKAFSDGVLKLNNGIQQRALARLEKDPSRRLQYLQMKMLAEAKKLVKLTQVKDLASLDAAAYDAELGTFEKTVTDLDTYAGQHKDEASRVTMFSMFLGEVKGYLKATKELSRRKREKKDFNKEFFSRNSPSMVEGHPAQIVDKYNRMIQSSNTLRM